MWRKEPFDDQDWLFDMKYDGYRALYSLGCPHHRRCGIGISPDRDITARRPDVAAFRASLPTAPLARTPAENRGFST